MSNADLHKLLNKFNDLGIEYKGFTPDDPTAVAKQEQKMMTPPQNGHSQLVSESVGNKFIPGVSDTSATDFAALAGVSGNKPRPSPAQPNPQVVNNTPSTDMQDIMNRLNNIETKLTSIFERLDNSVNEGDLIVKRNEFDYMLGSAMTDLISKSKGNPKVINTVQQLFKIATGKDVMYDEKHDTFTVVSKKNED